MSIGEIIRQYCFNHGVTIRSFAERCEVSTGYLSMLISGKTYRNASRPVKPRIETYSKFAEAMGITLNELFAQMAEDAPVDLQQDQQEVWLVDFSRLQHHRIPVVGSVAGGEPLYDEEVDLYVDGPINAKCAVRLKGHSMEPTFMDGDLIYIREQPNVDDGRIAMVILDDEACLKRVYHIKNGLQLLSDNPRYKPIIATSDDYDSIRIIGIPCGFTRMFGNGETVDVIE